MGDCMPKEQQEYLDNLQHYMFKSTNMTEHEAFDFAFRCWQFKDREKFRTLVFDEREDKDK